MEDWIVDLVDVDTSNLLEDWTWYFDSRMELVLVTALGDLFLKNQKGEVFFFSPSTSELKEIAESHEEFRQKFKDGENINIWFLPKLIDTLKESLGKLPKANNYGFIIPPFLNGQYEIKNFKIYPLKEYLYNMSFIYKQVKDLPEGTIIGDVSIE